MSTLRDAIEFRDEHRPHVPTYQMLAGDQILASNITEQCRNALQYIFEVLDALLDQPTVEGWPDRQLLGVRQGQARIAKRMLAVHLTEEEIQNEHAKIRL